MARNALSVELTDRRDVFFKQADAGGELSGVAHVGEIGAEEWGSTIDGIAVGTGWHFFDGAFALSMVAIMAMNPDATERERQFDTMLRLGVIGVSRLVTSVAEVISNSPLGYSAPVFPVLAGANLLFALYQLKEQRQLLNPEEWLKRTAQHIAELETQLQQKDLSKQVRGLLAAKYHKLCEDFKVYAVGYLDGKSPIIRERVTQLTRSSPRFQGALRIALKEQLSVRNDKIHVKDRKASAERYQAIQQRVQDKVNSCWANVAARAVVCVGVALFMINSLHPVGWGILAVTSAYYVYRQRNTISKMANAMLQSARNLFASSVQASPVPKTDAKDTGPSSGSPLPFCQVMTGSASDAASDPGVERVQNDTSGALTPDPVSP